MQLQISIKINEHHYVKIKANIYDFKEILIYAYTNGILKMSI